MSVKNILDGTIPITGGLTPESEISVKHVYSDQGLQTPGIIDVGGSAYISKQIITPEIITAHVCLPEHPNEDTNFSTLLKYNNITTPSLTAIESITTPVLAATGWIKTEVLKVISKITSTGLIEALSGVTASVLTATSSVTTPSLTLGETPVLTPTQIEKDQYIAVTYSERDEEILTAKVYSKVSNINVAQHVFTCQTSLKSLTKPIKQMIIPSGLDFTGKNNVSTNTTAVMINGTDLLLGLVHIYVENNQLMAMVVFNETPSYTSMIVRINIVFN